MSINHATPKTQRRAAELRRNQTEAETKLWTCLRVHRANCIHFRRQHAIGKFIVDFCAPRKKLIIEVDGDQHLEQREYDRERTRFLQSQSCIILRFWNHEVLKDIESVMGEILDTLEGAETSSE